MSSVDHPYVGTKSKSPIIVLPSFFNTTIEDFLGTRSVTKKCECVAIII